MSQIRPLSNEERVAHAEGRMHYDPHTLVNDLIKKGEEYADADAAASLLEETKGAVLGQMVQAYIQGKHSATAAEHMAKSSAMYRQHIAKMVEARRVANRARVNYDAGRTFLDLIRTYESTRRQEMAMGKNVP